MMIDHTRHSGIFSTQHLKVCLIGAGGIGALTAITLAKMGLDGLIVYDDDAVDDVNIATQFYRISDVGKEKWDAIDDQVREYSDHPIITMDVRVDENIEKDLFAKTADIYISAVDSIKSRKGIWHAIRKHLILPEGNLTNRWYIDARMGAEVFEMFVVKLNQHMWYQDHIRKASDDDMPDLPCTSKATIYTADIAAGHIGATVRRIATLDQIPGFLSHDIVENDLYYQAMNQSTRKPSNTIALMSDKKEKNHL